MPRAKKTGVSKSASPSPPSVANVLSPWLLPLDARKVIAEVLLCVPRNVELLTVFADSLTVSEFDAKTRELTLKFHLPIVSSLGPVERLTLVNPGTTKSFDLSFEAFGSPGAEKAFPQLPWAAKARLALNAKIFLGADAERVYGFFAEIAGQSIHVGRIYISDNLAPAVEL